MQPEADPLEGALVAWPEAPRAITARHRAWLAVVYVRLGLYPALPHELAALEAERAQRTHARRWGWPDDRILLLERDLGCCGCSARGRADFCELLKMMPAKYVGLVLVTGFSRLAQDWDDVVAFLDLCARTDTLLAVNGTLVDCVDPTANIPLRLEDLHRRHQAESMALIGEATAEAVGGTTSSESLAGGHPKTRREVAPASPPQRRRQ